MPRLSHQDAVYRLVEQWRQVWHGNSYGARRWRETHRRHCLREECQLGTCAGTPEDFKRACADCLDLHVEEGTRAVLFEIDRVQGRARSSRFKPYLPRVKL